MDAPVAGDPLDPGRDFGIEREIAPGDDDRFAALRERQNEAQETVRAARIRELASDPRRHVAAGRADGHLQARPFGQLGERLDALDGDPRRFITGATIKLDAEQGALAGLGSGFQRHRRLVVEGGRDELARSVAEVHHHVAAAPCRGAPARFLDQARHRRADALALRNSDVGQLSERLDLVRCEQMPCRVDRMGGEIEAEGVALRGHPLRERP
jgi:hypothetical protein